MGSINVAIIGVGNCASSLIQGVHYYKNAKEDEFVPGIMHVNLGGYYIKDINFVAAFDIDKNKVGKDLSEAIFTSPNNTFKFTDVPTIGVKVQRGMTSCSTSSRPDARSWSTTGSSPISGCCWESSRGPTVWCG